MEVHTLQQMLPDEIMNLVVNELDNRNMVQGTFNISRFIQSNQESSIDLKRSLL